jgi:hypothetical protein
LRLDASNQAADAVLNASTRTDMQMGLDFTWSLK